MCDGEKGRSPQAFKAAVNPAQWRFSIFLPHLKWEMARRFTAWRRGVTQEREGLFHIWLLCPWKLRVGGSFALDIQSLEIRATVGSVTYQLYLPCERFSLPAWNSNASLPAFGHQDAPKGKLLREISPRSYFVFVSLTARVQQAPACSTCNRNSLLHLGVGLNKTAVSQLVRGVSGFISWFSVAAGPLNSQRSDHSIVCSLTPHHFMHSLIQEHI